MAGCVRSRPEILTLIKLFIGDGGQAERGVILYSGLIPWRIRNYPLSLSLVNDSKCPFMLSMNL